MRPTKEDIARQFDRMSQAYADNPGHARGADLEIVLDFLQPNSEMRVLDLATGPGHTAAAIAPFVREVIASDIAPAMLERAAELATRRGLANMRVERIDAESIGYPDASFDAVTVRVAPHHFLDVGKAVREVARVLRPGGVFVLEDSVAPDDRRLDDYLNALERLRDPTHVRSLNRVEWEAHLRDAHLDLARTAIYRKEHGVDEWLATAGVAPAVDREVRAMLASATADAIARFAIAFDEQHRPTRFTDEKIIARAEKRA